MLPVIANAVNLLILICFLAYMLKKPASGMLRKRTDRVQGQLREAEEELTKAKELKLLYSQKMEEIMRERDEILSQAQISSGDTGRRIIAEAEKEAAAIRERAAANADMEWSRAQSEMRAIIIDASAVTTEKFVKKAIDKHAHDRLFDDIIADLEEVAWID